MVNRKLCGHWTAGTYNPCNEDIAVYHYLVDGTGSIKLKIMITAKMEYTQNIVAEEIQVV